MPALPKKNSNLKRSRLQERNAARQYGGRISPGSGNQWHSKNDVKTPEDSIELKTTTKHSFSLKAVDLEKAWKNALLDGRNAIFEIEFAEDGITCVVLDKSDYLFLRDLVTNLTNKIEEMEEKVFGE